MHLRPAIGWSLFSASIFTIVLNVAPVSGQQELDDVKALNQLNQQVMKLYQAGKYAEAIPLAQKVLEISEKALGPDNPDLSHFLDNLALLYYAMGDYAKAEPLARRALGIREKTLGPDHPTVAESLNKLAQLYRIMGDYAKAEPLYRRSLGIDEKALGPNHPHIAGTLS